MGCVSYTSVYFDNRPTIQFAEPDLEARTEYERRRELVQVAESKARQLLYEFLDDTQKEMLEKYEYFLVLGKSGKLYRLRPGRVGNIDQIGLDGCVETRWCVHPDTKLPSCDDLVAQLLHLRTDDEKLLRVANRMEPRAVDAGPVIDIDSNLPLIHTS